MSLHAGYPTSFTEIERWAGENGRSVLEARLRFAQYGVLLAIARSRTLGPLLVFKGGNALDFVWQPNRSTRDLDFSVDGSLEESVLARRLASALESVERSHNVAFRVHKIERQPPGDDKTFVTFHVRVGFCLADEAPNARKRFEEGRSPNVVPLDISLNEPICDATEAVLGGSARVRVSTPEDIVAEKLRALLQQSLRNRHRCQDVLDLAVILRGNVSLDPRRVARFLETKAAARQVPVSRRAFRQSDLAERARVDYAALQSTVRSAFIPFDEALEAVLSFVDRLPIAP